jgi:hypothetical protein
MTQYIVRGEVSDNDAVHSMSAGAVCASANSAGHAVCATELTRSSYQRARAIMVCQRAVQSA